MASLYNPTMTKPLNVDEYIAAQPAAVAKKLMQLRQLVKDNAPGAVEKLSYGMPYYSLNGRLVYFMAHTHHIGFYPMKSALAKFKNELSQYETGPGTVRFPLDKPLPQKLIKDIVRFRAQENLRK